MKVGIAIRTIQFLLQPNEQKIINKTELKDLFKYYKDKEYVNKINKVIENNSDLLKSLFWGCYFSLIFDTKTPESACEAAVNSFKNSVKKFLMEEEEDHIMLVNNEKCFSIGEPKGISNKRITYNE